MKLLLSAALALFSCAANAQYKSFKMSVNDDTINRVDKKNFKQGKWVLSVPPLRGEEGYEEEGMFKDDQKEGVFRRYTTQGDIIAVETYLHNGKDGIQQYYTPLGALVREESWKGFNPDSPYDTIAIYGTGSNEIVDYKIVKAEPYSVKQGFWKYYDPSDGRMIKSEEWFRNVIVPPDAPKPAAGASATFEGVKKKVAKTPEMLEWEKKNKGKKKVLRDGQTGI